MLSKIKKRVKIALDRMKMFNEFYHDYKEYKRWNYHNPKVKSRCAQEAKILRQTHIVEKGLSLSDPRRGFGKEKIETLLEMLDEYLAMGFPTNGIPFQNAICVLGHYVTFQKALGYENDSLNKKLETLKPYVSNDFDAGIAHTTLADMQKDIQGSFPVFFRSRHSMRQFADKPIDFADVEKAVKLAMKAPTACNRQACKVYYYTQPETNKKLGEWIAGNTGFDAEVQNYLVITADISAFYDTFERNQLYVEAGIFSMALMQALHYYGIGSCALQNGEYYKKNGRFKAICKNIPDNEKIVIFIAIGYYKETFGYAISKRKNVEDVLIKQ